MKKIVFKTTTFVLLAGVTMLSSSCIKETFPTNSVTQDQVDINPNSMTYLVNGINVWMGQFNTAGDGDHDDFGYPAMCIIRDRMGQDLVDQDDPFGWFSPYAKVEFISPEYVSPYFIWNFYYGLAAKANIVLRAADPESPQFLDDWYPSIGLAKFYRAFAYFDLVQMYQSTYVIAKDKPAVPIFDEKSGEAEATNAPRQSVEKVYEFILKDLAEAWKYLDEEKYGYSRSTINIVDRQVVAGLYARVYLTMGNGEKAAEYARLAMDGFVPLRSDQFNNEVTGFNDIMAQHSWIWGIDLTVDDECVQTGICNFTSFMSSGYKSGYTGAGAPAVIDANLYAQIGKKDFRAKTWVLDPESNRLLAYKFAPYQGNGKNELQACDFPLMRVEEMMLIEAEAEALTNPAKGKELLETFVKSYRDPDYTCKGSSLQEVRDAIWIQRRIELWGEGFSMLDIKRLQKGITRLYEGTNWSASCQWNFTVTPGYMNICIPLSETQNNSGIPQDKNNPTPSQPKEGKTYTQPYV